MDATCRNADKNEHGWILFFSCLILVGAAVLSVSDGGYIALRIPFGQTEVQFPGFCPTRVLLGVPCPGCGLTRSFVAMAHGQWKSAVLFNPMGPVLFLICCAQIPYRIGTWLGLGQESRVLARLTPGLPLVGWGILAGLLGQWVVRLALSF